VVEVPVVKIRMESLEPLILVEEVEVVVLQVLQMVAQAVQVS
jgi:hypothetical protein